MTWSRLGNCQMSTIAPFSLSLTHSLTAKLLCEMWYLPTLIMLRSLLLLLYCFFSQNWALWKGTRRGIYFKVVRYEILSMRLLCLSLFYFFSIFYVLKWVRFFIHCNVAQFSLSFSSSSVYLSIALWLHPFSSFLIAWQIQANFIFLSCVLKS